MTADMAAEERLMAGLCVIRLAVLALLLGAAGGLAQKLEWSVESAGARVADGRTLQTIRVTAANPAAAPVRLAVRVQVVDYFQTVLAEQMLDATLAAAATRVVTLPVVSDHAGPYVKVVLSGTAGAPDRPAAAVDDERLVFTDVLTGLRPHISLNGAWTMTDGVPGKPPPSAAAWTACELPYRWLTWNGAHTRWFRREFTVPETMRDKTLELRLNGVRFRAEVWCNGRQVKTADTDQMPFAVDLTATARVGQRNELLIGVTDWLSCVAPELAPVLKDVWSSAWMQGREIPGMPFIRPCTMGIGAAGISDPLYLVATPRTIALERCLITPSVRQSALMVKVAVNHHGTVACDRRVRVRVFGRETTVPVTLKPGLNEVALTLPVDLKTLTLWWPWKPHLYRLDTELLQEGKVVDHLDSRFGFREFWADGPVFRINGVAIRPNAAAGIPFDFPGLANYDEGSRIRNWYQEKKFLRSFATLNINLVRYHSEPYPILMFDLADELGLMVVSEAFMSTLPGKLKMDDARLWANLREFYPRWVEREFNHPSLVIRSIENELGYHLPAVDQPRSPWGYGDPVIQSIIKEMRALGRLVKRLDPSRPIMYEGSGSLFYEVADIDNLHYPGVPGGESLYPVTSRWNSMPIESYTLKQWQWDRQKPLYVGEYDSCFGEPKHFAPFLGNEAYMAGYLHAAHGATWSFSIPGQRIDGMTAGVPWTILTFNDVGNELNANTNWKLKLFKELTTPIASFLHQYRECYFGGRTITRTVTTLNDTLAPCPVSVRWRLERQNGTVFRQGVFDFKLAPAGSRRSQWELVLPAVTQPTPCRLIVETHAAGALSHTDQRPLVIYPDTLPTVNTSTRVGVLGMPAAELASMQVKAVELSPTHLDLSAVDVVVVAGGTAGLKAYAGAIDRFLRTGGRLVLLERTTAPDFLPFALPLAPGQKPMVYADDTRPGVTRSIPAPGSSMTIVHPLIPGHPLLKGLGPEQLRYWGEDHLTAAHTYQRPEEVFARPILGCGIGLQQTPLMEIPWGRGLVVAVQLPVVAAAPEQPAARLLLANLLAYVDQWRAASPRPGIGVLGGNGLAPTFLNELRVKPVRLTGRLAETSDLSSYSVILVAPDDGVLRELAGNRSKLVRYVQDGGCVWFHLPTPAQMARINGLLPVPVTMEPLALKAPVKVAGTDLLAGVSRDELFWPEGNFLPTASPRVAAYAFSAPARPEVVPLTDPVVALAIHDGKGEWLLDTVAWDGEYAERTRAQRYVRAILLNCGVQLEPCSTTAAPPKLDASLGYRPLELSRFCNEGFLGGVWNGPNMGLKKLPVGDVVLKGVPFAIVDPGANAGKSCLGFRAVAQNPNGIRTVTVPFGGQAAAFHLLVTSLWSSSLPALTKVLVVEIDYADGTRRTAEVCYGRDVLDWCPPDLAVTRTHPAVAWIGPEWPTPGLYDFVWYNPEPAKPIRALTLSAANDTGFAVVVAVTAQQHLSAAQRQNASWIPGLAR
jgi:hypothetical protein